MVKLTEFAAKGGCACKIGPHILGELLQTLPSKQKAEVLVDMSGSDDAGVIKISDTLALVQTVDFFTPLVDDPYWYGKIAATNSVSDIYAMGGEPKTALNIVAFPIPLVEQGVLSEVLRGANEVLESCGVALLGGHSIEDEVPKFGLAVTGYVHPEKIWENKGALEGDVLVLTKPLGTGVLTTAAKGGLFPEGVELAIQTMTTLNKSGAEVGRTFTIHACTDVTGFSLMGHAREMMKASHCSCALEAKALPMLPYALEGAEMGLVPAATYGNRKALGESIFFDVGVSAAYQDICFDPQTSGGLLFSLPAREGEAFVESLKEKGLYQASIIGRVMTKGAYDVYVY